MFGITLEGAGDLILHHLSWVAERSGLKCPHSDSRRGCEGCRSLPCPPILLYLSLFSLTQNSLEPPSHIPVKLSKE